MKYKFENFVSGLAFGSNGSFACPVVFGEYCGKRFEELVGQQESDASNLAMLKELIDALEGVQSNADKSGSCVLDTLVHEDLIKICRLAESLDPSFLDPASVLEATEEVQKVAGDLGFVTDDLSLRVVDDFPSPYTGAGFAAMSYDRVDHSDYGIEVGVALKKSDLRPLYSQVLLGHEFAHFIIGQKPTDILARGLEEGIADYLGGVLIVGELIGRNLAEDVLIAMRRRFGQTQFWRIYRDGLAATSSAILLQGESGFLKMVRKANREGRGVVKEFERQLLRGELPVVDVEANDGRAFAQRFISLTPENTLSPLSFYVCRSTKVGEKFEDVAERLGLDESDVEKAVTDAQNSAFMAIPYGGKVYSNEAPFYFEEGSLRYLV